MFELKNLSYSYGNTKALSDITLTIPSGAFLAVTGPSGSGKSTLLRHFNGLLHPSTGSITADNAEYVKNRINTKVGLVFQSPEDQLFEDSVLKDVMFGPSCLNLSNPEERARQALQQVGIPESLSDRHPLSLSGGERRLVAIAGILAFDPSTLVLDEPAAGLDYVTKKRLFSLLQSLNSKGKTIIFSSHNMDDVAENASHVLQLRDGKAVAYGTPRDIIKTATAQAIAAVLRANSIPLPASPLTLAELEQSLTQTFSAL